MKKRTKIAATVAALGLVWVATTAGACDTESKQDLSEKKVTQVEPEGARSYHSPDGFPNVVTYCIVGGHRVILNTRDFGNPVVPIPNDPSCQGAR